MRPVQLELTNFGPYRKEVINFTQFDHAPLFLIGGDTGVDAAAPGFIPVRHVSSAKNCRATVRPAFA